MSDMNSQALQALLGQQFKPNWRLATTYIGAGYAE